MAAHYVDAERNATIRIERKFPSTADDPPRSNILIATPGCVLSGSSSRRRWYMLISRYLQFEGEDRNGLVWCSSFWPRRDFQVRYVMPSRLSCYLAAASMPTYDISAGQPSAMALPASRDSLAR